MLALERALVQLGLVSVRGEMSAPPDRHRRAPGNGILPGATPWMAPEPCGGEELREGEPMDEAESHGDRDGDSDWLPWRSQPAGSAIGVTVASGPR